MFAVKTRVLKELLDDPEWSQRLLKTENISEVVEVLKSFCKARKYKFGG